ncbi:hypothetical protein M409DRAFT_70417 [Zasmidium cellare ATCC 36951]|uniref:MAGE domain-containing protein n=1 Tax=Zasmidium cellare ATCC 36951 TaxID=1080233 RepID=A0A6A6C3X9_ZASCE|nr:uncharacterized protein M409DRAFT_70417 [Zasmidium cellare ATCC 36951]KAF2160449.1 hypothetical protein M409DRAFT_70417 [Zasmidium cellare ATCC 36951]
MPTLQRRKRRSEPEEAESSDGSQGPETQRRRTTEDADEEEDYGVGGATQGEGTNEMAMKLVRLALALEFQRRPLRRSDISEKVLGPNGRQFKHVFNQAQIHLRTVFGMELVELPAKEKVTLQQKRAAQKSASQAKATASWVLTSILPSNFRDPAIIQPLSAPTAVDESKYTAVYTVLVSMIRLSGGALPDAKMERSLQRLQMEDNTPVVDFEKTEKLMKRLEKDGYIVRIKESTGTGEDDVYWTVGPRGKVEIGDNGVRGLTKAVYGEQESETAEDELERKIDRSLGISERLEQINREQAAEKPKKGGRKKQNQQQEEEEEDEGEDEEGE